MTAPIDFWGPFTRALFGETPSKRDFRADTTLIAKVAGAFPGKAVGPFQVLTFDGTVQFLPDEASAMSAMLVVQAQAMRWTIGETEPSATVAFRAEVGTILKVTGRDDLRSFRFRNDGIFNGTLFVQFFA